MAATSGVSQAFKFGATTYSTTNCIQGSTFNTSVNAGMYQCGGVMRTALGAKTYVLNVSLAIDGANDSAVVTALEPGDNTTAFTYYPNSTASGDIKWTSTKAWVVSANYSSPVNGVITADITINLDNATFSVA